MSDWGRRDGKKEKVGEDTALDFVDFVFVNPVIIAEHRAARHHATYETRHQHYYDHYDVIDRSVETSASRGNTSRRRRGGGARTILTQSRFKKRGPPLAASLVFIGSLVRGVCYPGVFRGWGAEL